jgi:hypothetical protein
VEQVVAGASQPYADATMMLTPSGTPKRKALRGGAAVVGDSQGQAADGTYFDSSETNISVSAMGNPNQLAAMGAVGGRGNGRWTVQGNALGGVLVLMPYSGGAEQRPYQVAKEGYLIDGRNFWRSAEVAAWCN